MPFCACSERLRDGKRDSSLKSKMQRDRNLFIGRKRSNLQTSFGKQCLTSRVEPINEPISRARDNNKQVAFASFAQCCAKFRVNEANNRSRSRLRLRLHLHWEKARGREMLADKLDEPGWPFSPRWDARFVQGAKRHLRNAIARALKSPTAGDCR